MTCPLRRAALGAFPARRHGTPLFAGGLSSERRCRSTQVRFPQLSIESMAVGMFAALQKKKKLPVVTCPGCKKAMRAGPPKPILFAKGLADITYVCEKCGTKTRRTVKEK